MICVLPLQWCSEQTEQVLFFIQNTHSREGRKLPKHYVKFKNFPQLLTLHNVGGFSMSFGYKIKLPVHWFWSYEPSKLKVAIYLTKEDFFRTFNFDGS